MNTISNDFVTIEFETPEQEKIAKYYIDVFNLEPELYKGLLNGKNIIHSNELEKLEIDDEEFSHYNENKGIIIDSIISLVGAKRITFCGFQRVMPETVYSDIIAINFENTEGIRRLLIYYDLAYDYYCKENDSTYIKKYLYDDELSIKDIYYLCDYNVINHFDELLKEKIKCDRLLLDKHPHIKDNLSEILEILQYMNNHTYNELDKLKSLFENNKKISKVNERKFNKLVMEALNYIDPTNKLVEEYLELKKNKKIIRTHSITGYEVSQFMYNKGNSEIKVYINEDISDVITFIHEFAHYHYLITDRKLKQNNMIFTEYPSIYYEMKTAEFLEQKGYSKDEVTWAKGFRTISNNNSIQCLIPNLLCMKENNDKPLGTFEIEPMKKHIEKFIQEALPTTLKNFPQMNEEEAKKKLYLFFTYHMLEDITRAEDELEYIIGTYLSRYSISLIKHPDTLRILDDITNNKRTLSDVFDMFEDYTDYKHYQKIKRKSEE